MVVTLGPGKFYGSSLPRPRFYTDVKLNETRIDPPVPVMDPLMKWAESAHWSMGGLSFTRHRLQGRIEGKVENLRKQKKREDSAKCSSDPRNDKGKSKTKSKSPSSAPPAPRVEKRRRVVGLADEEEEDGDQAEVRRVVRKLGDEFEKIASECGMATRSSSKKTVDDVNNSKEKDNNSDNVGGKRKRLVKVAERKVRSSPRLGKKGGD